MNAGTYITLSVLLMLVMTCAGALIGNVVRGGDRKDR